MNEEQKAEPKEDDTPICSNPNCRAPLFTITGNGKAHWTVIVRSPEGKEAQSNFCLNCMTTLILFGVELYDVRELIAETAQAIRENAQ